MTTVNYAFTEITFATDVSIVTTGVVYIAASGTVELNAGVRFKGAKWFPAGTYAFRGPGTVVGTAFSDVRVPPTFTSAGWSIADSATANALDLTLTTLPLVNGFALVRYQWSLDGTTWTNITRKTTGTEVLPCGSTGAKTVKLRQLTEQGYSAPSAAKSATVA